MNCDTPTIILAEDDPTDIILVREALKRHPIRCVINVIQDGAEVLAVLDSLDNHPQLHSLDLLLVNMHLPKRDGEEILKKLRSIEHHAQTPGIVMTAFASPRDRAAAEKHAAFHYFSKPSNLNGFMELGALIGGILSAIRQSGRVKRREQLGDAFA